MAVVVGIDPGLVGDRRHGGVRALVSVVMPDPVPRELITGGRNHIDSRQPPDLGRDEGRQHHVAALCLFLLPCLQALR